MSTWLLIVVTLIYVCVSISHYWEGNNAGALVFFGYSVANLGFIWGFDK